MPHRPVLGRVGGPGPAPLPPRGWCWRQGRLLQAVSGSHVVLERAPEARACWRVGPWAVLAGGCLCSPALDKPCPCSAQSGFRGRALRGAGAPHPCRVTAKAGSRSTSPSPSFLEGPGFLEGCVLLQWRALSSGGLCLPHLEALVGVCVHTPPAAVSRGQVLGSPRCRPGQASPALLLVSSSVK